MLKLDRKKLAIACRTKRGADTLPGAAEASGVGHMTLYRIEMQKDHDFGVDKFLRLCTWLDVPVDYFLTREAA